MANCKINSNSGAYPSGNDRTSLELSLGLGEAEKGFWMFKLETYG